MFPWTEDRGQAGLWAKGVAGPVWSGPRGCQGCIYPLKAPGQGLAPT